MVMPRLCDRVSHPFAPKILTFTVYPHVQTARIDYYKGESDPVEHIQRHKVSLVRRTNDDNHCALLFPTTLGGIASH